MSARRSTRSAAWLAAALACWFAGAACAAEATWPGEDWERVRGSKAGLDEATLLAARGYALTGGGSGLVTRHGKVVLEWGDLRQLYDLKSSTKSFGSVALGLAVGDGKGRLDERARRYHPGFGLPPQTNAHTGWLEEVTLRHLATQTAGFAKPGGYSPLVFLPGSKWGYSDCGPNWLAECLTLVYRQDLDEVMFARVFEPIGITRRDLVWRKNAYRPAMLEGIPNREFGSGISANVNAMARLGYLMLREGRWRDAQILPAEYAREAPRTPSGQEKLPVLEPDNYGRAASHYGLLWWNNNDGTLPGVPRDAFWSWGLYDSLIVVIPSLDIVAARAGKSWKRDPGTDHYDVLKGFLQPIARSASSGTGSDAGKRPTRPIPASPESVDVPAAIP